MADIADHAHADPIGGDRRDIRRRALSALAVLVALSAAAAISILVYAGNERDRLRQEWDVRLGIVADSRKAAVEGWMDQRQGDLLRLAGNRAVQFFLVDRADPEVPAEAVDARLRYIEELLAGEAVRGGYLNETEAVGGGLVLRDTSGSVVASSPGAPASELAPLDGVREARGRAVVSPMIDAGAGIPIIAVTAPIVAIEGAVGGEPMGYLTGFLRLDPEFFALLRQPGDLAGEISTRLLQGQGEETRIVSPEMSQATVVSGSYATALAGKVGGSGAFVGPDGSEVLAVSRAIRDTNWTLVRLVDRNTALSDGERRIWLMAGVLLLAVLLAGVGVVAVWRHAISDRLASAASDLSAALSESDRLSNLLQRLADAVPNGILAVGVNDRVLFGNRAALKVTGIDAREAEGKDLVGLFGPGRAGPLLTANDKVRTSGETVREVDDHQDLEGRQVTLRSHVPLGDDGVLLVAEDMTEIVVEREARSAQLDSLVNVLVDLIDARDSYAAHHSRRVARLSRAMAEQMHLGSEQVSAAETAARLMNLGKLKIDPAVLTKTGDLTEEERISIRDSILHSADLVQGIGFEGPVVETLRQLQERFDGSGRPEGLSGADFLVTAQIVSLANAYVALISDRAHRSALTSEEAQAQLWDQAGSSWDRPVVAALVQAAEAATELE
jgi:PAS domain-containing protein